jgi:hypothetical protein
MTVTSVAAFEYALDAACLIFAHSVLDSAALDWCRVCARAAPNDLLHRIDQKRFTVSEIKETSFPELQQRAIEQFFESLERESLIKKLDLMFELCRPRPGFQGLRGYRYDRDRIVALDNLRHEFVHGDGVGVRLPQAEADLL